MKNLTPKCKSTEQVFSHRSDSGIKMFDPRLLKDTVVSKSMEDFNTKFYVMNN